MKQLVLGQMPIGAEPESVLAAGPWCFCGVEASFPEWEERFTFAPEPLANKELLPVAARAAQTLCIKLVPVTAALLCSEPDRLPQQYWQTLLSSWLMDLSSQLVDRALRVQAMKEAWGEMALQVDLLPEDSVFAFKDEHDFTLRGSLGTRYNHWLFSFLFRQDWPTNWECGIFEQKEQSRSPASGGILERIRSFGRDISHSLLFPRLKNMSMAEALRLSRALDHTCKTENRSLDLAKAFDYQDDLKQIPLPADLQSIVRASLPQSLVRLQHKEPPRDKKAPRLKVAGPECSEDASYRQSLAVWEASGNRIAHVQHGANYGAVLTPCNAAVAEYSGAAFFTWGWKTQGCAKGNFIPMPALQLRSDAAWHPGEDIIFTGTEMPAYGRRLDSHPTPLEYLAYREDKAKFFEALGIGLQERTLYRPYFPLPGTLQDAEWLLPRFPSLRLCEGPLISHILNCRLLILDHPGTTLLEAMACGVPLIAYWRRDFWPFVPESEVLLDMLEAAGIWFPEPEAAAKKVHEIWSDTAHWWNSPEIWFTEKFFCRHHARRSRDVISQWIKVLGNL